jgi:hypothetical protein
MYICHRFVLYKAVIQLDYFELRLCTFALLIHFSNGLHLNQSFNQFLLSNLIID